MDETDAYQTYAVQQAQAYGIDPNVFLQQLGQESSWDPNAQNGNASGIAQFMPSTAAQYGVDTSDPYSSITGAAQYDSDLLNANGGNYQQMLTSYGTLSNDPTANNGPGSSIWNAFQNTISGAGNSTTGTGTTSAGSTGATSAGSSSSTSSGISGIISKYGSSLLAIILGMLMIAAGIWGAVK